MHSRNWWRKPLIAIAVLAFGWSLTISAGSAQNTPAEVKAFLEAIHEAQTAEAKTAPVTPATDFHGLPGNNAGFSDQQNGACPASNGNPQCDGGIHGIGNNPGQSGNSPDPQGDEPPACDMHGGLHNANQNCNDD